MHCLETMSRLNDEAIERFHRCTKPAEPKPADTVVWSTLIPVRFNNGEAIPQSVVSALLETVGRYFGGYTLDGVSTGVWYDADGKRFADASQRLTVACYRSRLDDARGYVKRIGIATGQKCMPFFVDGRAEFVELPESEPEPKPAHNFPRIPVGYVPYGWSTIDG
jgi:hypothetical protein